MLRILFFFYQWLIAFPILLVLTIITALVTIVGCFIGDSKVWGYYPGRIWSQLFCWISFVRVKVKGRENIDKKTSYVFVANHQGAYDIFLIYGFLDHQDKKKKKELQVLKNYQETIVFYESPHRITKTLKLMEDILGDRPIALCREITKKHEEILRGSISEITKVAGDLKGEMVIVVSGNNNVIEETVFEQTIVEHVDEYVSKGMTVKDAIKEVAKLRNIKKNEVYATYHQKDE